MQSLSGPQSQLKDFSPFSGLRGPTSGSPQRARRCLRSLACPLSMNAKPPGLLGKAMNKQSSLAASNSRPACNPKRVRQFETMQLPGTRILKSMVVAVLVSTHMSRGTLRPNPSLKRSANGRLKLPVRFCWQRCGHDSSLGIAWSACGRHGRRTRRCSGLANGTVRMEGPCRQPLIAIVRRRRTAGVSKAG